MKIGEDFEYEKVKEKKKYKINHVNLLTNGSDEEGTIGRAQTRFDNDDCPDQFDEYNQLCSDSAIMKDDDTFSENAGHQPRRFQDHPLSSTKQKQRRVFYSPSQRIASNNLNQH